jgi:RNA polymerase sigma-70 factor (ECF subfamily)
MSDSITGRAEEHSLVARARAGDHEAFEALVRQHQQQVFAVAYRMLGNRDEAADVAQEVFVRAYRSLKAFRGEARLSTWLVSISMNQCRNRRRWWARHRRVVVASLDDPLDDAEDATLAARTPDPGPTPAAEAQRRDVQRQLHAALQQLEAPDREIIVLRDLHGYAYDDIAQILKCRLGTVKSRLSRARLALRSSLDGRF